MKNKTFLSIFLFLLFSLATAWADTVDLSSVSADTSLQNGDVVTGTLGANVKISIADNATVTLNGVTINGVNNTNYRWAGITCEGNCEIILAGNNIVKGFYEHYSGIYVPEEHKLIISGTGFLDARSNGYGAGIGASMVDDAGDITINGGTVTATGGSNAAGIGGGDQKKVGNITINGGTVTATGGQYAAGIGSGLNGTVGNITIRGSKTRVTARSGEGAPCSIGIGLGGSRSGTIIIGGVKYSDGIEINPFDYEANPSVNSNNSLELDYNKDNTDDIAAAASGGLYNVTFLNRIIYADGSWNTLTLPFSLTVSEVAASPLNGFTIKELDATTSVLDGEILTLNFKEARAIEAGKPYIVKANVDLIIHDKDEWESFANRVNNDGETFEGKVVKLADDFDNSGSPVMTMVGTHKNSQFYPFKGTFDGNGRTLTVGIDSDKKYTAPFRFVNGATVKNLTVVGNIQASQAYVGGMFAFAEGNNVITNCRVSATITSTVNGGGTVGGFVSEIRSGHTSIVNSLFDGSFKGTSTTHWSGFVGWAGAGLSISNSLFSPANINVKLSDEYNKTFWRGSNGYTPILTRCYYKRAYERDLETEEQGIDARSMDVSTLVSGLGSSNWETVNDNAVPKMFTANIVNPTFIDVAIDAGASTIVSSTDGHMMLNGTYGPFDDAEGLLFDVHNTVNGAFHAALSATRDGYVFSGWYTDAAKNTSADSIPFGVDGNAILYTKWKKLLTNPEISIDDISDTTYIGSEIEPKFSINDGETSLTLGTDYTVSYSDNINAGNATVTITGQDDYSGTVEKTFKIARAPLIITALNDTIVYGDEPSNAGVKFDGFVGKDNEKSLNGTLVYSNEYEQYGDVGEFAITPSGLTADNYEIEFVAGKLTVEPKVVFIAWDKQTSFTYNSFAQVPAATAEGLLNNDQCDFTVAGAATDAGKYTATVTGLNNRNYKLPATGLEQAFEITKAPLTVTAKNATIAYGDEPSNAGVEYSGFVGDDNENDLNDSIVFNYDYAPFDKVGKYAIIPGGLSSDNYDITFVDGKLTVEPKEISIAWSDASFTYNGSEQIPMATANGVENSDECIFTVMGAATNAGKYTAKVTDLSNENYKLPETGIEQAFEIKKAPLKITALNDTIVYGDEPASAGIAYDGFVGKETSNVLNGELAFEINYKQYGDVGEFAITPSGLTADNYEIEFVAGKLTVEPKVVFIAWNDETSFTYDGKAHAPNATAEGLVNNDECNFVIDSATNAGKYTAKVTDLSNKNYKLPATGLEQSFEIAKIPLTVTAKNNTIVYGDEPSNAGVEYSGFVVTDNEKSLNGSLVYSYDYKQYGDAGEYSITPSGLTADNYEIEFVAGKLTVEPKDVSVAWGKSSFVYNSLAQVPAATAEGLVNSDKCGLTVAGAATNAGKYTATVTGLNNKNYKLPATGLEQAFEITKANPTLDKAPVGVENLVYNGKAQTLVTAGEAENGVMVYKLEGSDKYSETLPTATEAGDYIVYFMVQGNENYNDLKAQSLKASIAAPASSSSVVESSSSVEIASNSSSSRNDMLSSSSRNDNVSSSSRKDKSSSSSHKGKSSSSSSKEKKEGFTPVVASGLNVQFVRNELSLTVPTTSEVNVCVFDLQGNLKKQYHGHSAGTYNVSLDQMGRGTYLVRVVSGSNLRTLRVQVK